ncbi:Uncharacterized [Syntrophomonas zehnderi OL-4]|uniref:Uncharacterized n=1 Tax=Syntrophomonas zehnderi OL-4 TaxID=690567 RepID=A0A0E4C7K0_9FIRM|nr:efflux RND transporter periplasmic adaptor subunit [Syntrophomonas zehnderi]CFX01807.1 Uncharacterized [Syntrophomonas zehnderi OL-4]
MTYKKPILLVLIIMLLGATGIYYLNTDKDPNYITASGTIEATTVDVTARAPGTVEALHFQEGSMVYKDQLLAVLSRSDLLAQKERDAMGVLTAAAKLQDLKSGARAQEIMEAVGNVKIAESNLDKANRDLHRAEALFKEGALAQESLDQARTNAAQKNYLLDTARARQNLLEAGSRPEQINAAAAELERSKAVLKASESILQDLQLTSPLTGTVLNCNYEPGEFIPLGSSLATIADLQKMWIKVYIPTDDLPHIKLGQKVHFTVSGDNNRYTGIVSHIASRGEFTPKTIQTPKERTNVVFAVKISFENKKGTLKIGMPADVIFDEV